MPLLNPRTGLRVPLPGDGDVERFSPEAAAAIRAYHELDASLPARRSPDQLNALDDAHGCVVAMLLDPTLEEKRAKDRERRLKAIGEHLDAARALWAEEESDRGFTRWRTTFSAGGAQISGLHFRNGAGQQEAISGQRVLASLREAIAA